MSTSFPQISFKRSSNKYKMELRNKTLKLQKRKQPNNIIE